MTNNIRNIENQVISGKVEEVASNTQKPIGKKVSKVKGGAQVSDNFIVGSAFVPEANQNHRSTNQQNALREEAGCEPEVSFADLFTKGWKVSARHFGVPKNGEHLVVLGNEPEVHKSKDGFYVKFELYEKSSGLVWMSTGINQKDLENLFNTISAYNNGMLAMKSPVQAMNYLKTHEFRVWTVVTEPGKAVSYFNEEKYDKRCYVLAKQASEQK